MNVKPLKHTGTAMMVLHMVVREVRRVVRRKAVAEGLTRNVVEQGGQLLTGHL